VGKLFTYPVGLLDTAATIDDFHHQKDRSSSQSIAGLLVEVLIPSLVRTRFGGW